MQSIFNVFYSITIKGKQLTWRQKALNTKGFTVFIFSSKYLFQIQYNENFVPKTVFKDQAPLLHILKQAI